MSERTASQKIRSNQMFERAGFQVIRANRMFEPTVSHGILSNLMFERTVSQKLSALGAVSDLGARADRLGSAQTPRSRTESSGG